MGNALAQAIEEKQPLSVVQAIVRSNPGLLRKKDMKTGWVPLHVAARYNASLDVVRILVEEYPKALLVTTRDGSLPLHVVAIYGAPVEVYLYLTDVFPDALLVQNNNGWLPLHFAAQWSSLEVVQCLADKCPEALLVKQVEGWLPLHFAARHASLAVVQYLADKCPEALLVMTTYGSVPLHVAAQHASREVVQCLASKCPEALIVKNSNGWLPVHLASMYSTTPEVVQCLADMCPDALLVKQKDGWLPLHVAAKYASVEVVRCLVDKCPVALIVKTKGGKLPVDLAREYNTRHPDVETWLVWLEAARQTRQDHDRVSNERLPHTAPVQAPSPHAQDRDRVRRAVEHPSYGPALVSVLYVESIKTRSFLGDGFFGTVYKGTDLMLCLDFAMKSINTEILRGGTKQELEDAMRTFKTEQKALSRFRHPNIAALFAYTDPLAEGTAAGYHLMYELAEKGSLDKLLEDDLGRSRLGSFQRRVQVAIDVMTAIQFLHKGNDEIKTCFHRDVKSANIVLKRDFTAQLIVLKCSKR